jgi:hypothetical protein
MEAIRDAAAGVLSDVLSRQPVTPAKVGFAWQIAAGPALSRAASVSWTEDGTLRLQPRTPEWRREILRARPVLLQRLRQLLGAGIVARLVIGAPSVSRGGTPEPRNPRT